MIRLKRATQYADKHRAYKVVLDGLVVGEIRDGEAREFSVPQGPHTFWLKIDWCSSNKLDFESNDGDLDFECGNPRRGLALTLAPLSALFSRSVYLQLRKVKRP
jgi:hypothetical protein